MSRRLLTAATIVAIVATLGSLYFSEIANLVPCELCWYQRILMYPLVPILGVAAYEDRPRVWLTALPLSVLGIGVAGYHSFLQESSGSGLTCTVGGCGSVQWEYAIFTIPRLSLIAFILITGALLSIVYRERSDEVDVTASLRR